MPNDPPFAKKVMLVAGVAVVLLLAWQLVNILLLVFASVLGGVMSGTNELILGGIGFYVLCIVLYLPVLIVLGGILTAYIESAWTLTYLEATGRGGSAEMADDSLDEAPAAA